MRLYPTTVLTPTARLLGEASKRSFSERGGGLAESKISLAEKTEIFLDFFAERGGGLTQSKRVLAEKNGF